MNILALLTAAFSCLVVGFIWYGPLFGKTWLTLTGLNPDELKKRNMFYVLGLTFVFAFFIAMSLQMLVIHQMGVNSLIGGDPKNPNVKASYFAFIADYAFAFRTFKHGLLHGILTGVFFIFPLISVNGLFEQKSWKYIFLHSGYWTVCLGIMGGIICAWV